MLWDMIKKRIKSFSLIDYVVILILLFVGVFFASRYINRTETIYLYLSNLQDYYGQEFAPPYWQSSKLKVGDKSYNGFGNVVAEVTDIKKNVWSSGSRFDVEIEVRVKVTYDKNQKQYILDGDPILIGDRIKFTFNNSHYDGLIRDIYRNSEDRQAGFRKARAEVSVRLKNYEIEHLNKLKDFELKGSDGKVLLRIKEQKIFPAKMYSLTSTGASVFYGTDINHMGDSEIIVELPDVWCKDNICYYNYYKTFSIGSEFWADNGEVWFGVNSVIIDRKIIYE